MIKFTPLSLISGNYFLFSFSFLFFKYRSNVTLSQRVEYLARAVVCMRSDQAGYAPYLGIFLRELEDKVEVARIQQQVSDYKYYGKIYLEYDLYVVIIL